VTSLKDHTAIITGANQGLGFALASKLVSLGANVVIAARDSELLDVAYRRLSSEKRFRSQEILSMSMDVTNSDSVDELFKQVLSVFGGFQALINNAGIYGPKGDSEEVSMEEWKEAIDVNVIGSVLMARRAVAYFKQVNYGKIVQLGGGGAANPMPKLTAYAASKAAIVRFMESLASELKGTNIDVNSIAPGPLNTRMLQEILQAGPDKVGEKFYQQSLAQNRDGGAGFEPAIRLICFLVSRESDGISGKLISALWDDWPDWINHKEELVSTDVYTLRRIVGRDRNLGWGDL